MSFPFLRASTVAALLSSPFPPLPLSTESTLILGQYKMLIDRSDLSAVARKAAVRSVAIAAGLAALVAILTVIILGLSLQRIGSKLDKKTITLIEGVSKVVASYFILKLSLKVPRWLNVYLRADKAKGSGLSNKELFINVSWNIWREVAEAAVFLVPFFLAEVSTAAIPLSVFIGTVIGTTVGSLIYFFNTRFKNLRSLAIFMSSLMGFLAVGLFAYGLHEFEEVGGETAVVYKIPVNDVP